MKLGTLRGGFFYSVVGAGRCGIMLKTKSSCLPATACVQKLQPFLKLFIWWNLMNFNTDSWNKYPSCKILIYRRLIHALSPNSGLGSLVVEGKKPALLFWLQYFFFNDAFMGKKTLYYSKNESVILTNVH